MIEDNSHHIIHSSFHHATKGKSAENSAAPHGYRCDVESLQDVLLHHAHNYFAKRDCFCLRLCHFSFKSLTFQTPPLPPQVPPTMQSCAQQRPLNFPNAMKQPLIFTADVPLN